MFDHRIVSVPGFWCDHKGKVWPIVRSHRRLKFKYPAHAALRAFVHHRDGYRCLRCDVKAIDVPEDYDGRHALSTAASTHDGWAIALVCDHILTLKAGGTSRPSNLQSLCETCNRQKLPEDLRAIAAYRDQAMRGSL